MLHRASFTLMGLKHVLCHTLIVRTLFKVGYWGQKVSYNNTMTHLKKQSLENKKIFVVNLLISSRSNKIFEDIRFAIQVSLHI